MRLNVESKFSTNCRLFFNPKTKTLLDHMVQWGLDDNTTNQYNGVPVNNPALTDDRFGNPNSAYYFNGTNGYFGDEMADQWSGSRSFYNKFLG